MLTDGMATRRLRDPRQEPRNVQLAPALTDGSPFGAFQFARLGGGEKRLDVVSDKDGKELVVNVLQTLTLPVIPDRRRGS